MESGLQLKESGIRRLESGIQVPLKKNPESSIWNADFTVYNPESTTLLKTIRNISSNSMVIFNCFNTWFLAAWLKDSSIWPKVGVTACNGGTQNPSIAMNNINIQSVAFIKTKVRSVCYEMHTGGI